MGDRAVPQRDDGRLVERLIERIAEVEGIAAGEARERLHRSMCAETCEWYHSTGKKVGFDRIEIGEGERERMEALMCEVMRAAEVGEARRRIHIVLCGR